MIMVMMIGSGTSYFLQNCLIFKPTGFVLVDENNKNSNRRPRGLIVAILRVHVIGTKIRIRRKRV